MVWSLSDSYYSQCSINIIVQYDVLLYVMASLVTTSLTYTTPVNSNIMNTVTVGLQYADIKSSLPNRYALYIYIT